MFCTADVDDVEFLGLIVRDLCRLFEFEMSNLLSFKIRLCLSGVWLWIFEQMFLIFFTC